MRATLFGAPAGLGKTGLFAKLVACAVVIYEVYVPTLTLAESWRDLILSFNPNKRVQIIRGRSAPPPVVLRPKSKKRVIQPIAMCLKNQLATDVARAGEAVYPSLCSRSQGPGVAPVRCQYYEHCDYINQFSSGAEVYIYTHAHLGLERGHLEDWRPAEVIIDESFFQSLVEKIDVPLSLLTHSRIPTKAQSLCGDVARAIAARGAMQGRFNVATSTGELQVVLKALASPPSLSPNLTSAQQRTALKQIISFKPVRQLLTQLAAECRVRPTPQSIDYDVNSGIIALYKRAPITRFDRPDGTQPFISILDASADRQIIEPFFEIEKFLHLRVRRKAYVIQCCSTRCSTTSLVPLKNTDPKSAADATRRLADLTALIAKVGANGNKVLVIGPTAITGNPKTGQAPLITAPPHCELAHFNGVRGVDRWKDFDVIVVVGRNEPPPVAVENIARALFYDDPVPLTFTGGRNYEVRGYRLAEGAFGVETAVHADRRVQAVLEQLRESETLQAIDRLRLIYCVDDKLVILLSNIPLDLDVDELRTWPELMNGSRLEQAWEAAAGVGIMPLAPAWLAANHSALWPTAAAAKKDVARVRKKGQFPNEISIRKTSPFGFDYKLRRQRRWSVCLADTDEVAIVTQRLTALLGQAVDVRAT